MAIKGLAFHEEHEFISKFDAVQTREEGATIFKWRPLPNWAVNAIADGESVSQMDFGDMGRQTFIRRQATLNREVFRRAVSGWDNFFVDDDKKVPVDYKRGTVMELGRTFEAIPEDVMNRIPNAIIQELGSHIYQACTLTETQRKNFEAVFAPSARSNTSNAQPAETPTNSNEGAENQA